MASSISNSVAKDLIVSMISRVIVDFPLAVSLSVLSSPDTFSSTISASVSFSGFTSEFSKSSVTTSASLTSISGCFSPHFGQNAALSSISA